MPRVERVEQEMRKELNSIIAHGLKDPRIDANAMISVTMVETAKELKYAKVYVSIFNNEKPQEILKVLNKASSYLRGELFKRLKIREVPELHFFIDESLEYGYKIDKLLKEINKKEQ